MTRALTAVLSLLLLGLPRLAAACPVCFGSDQGPLTQGSRTAAFFLLGLTAVMLVAVATVGWSIQRRNRK